MVTIKQGETYIKSIQILYAETREPVDLTGYSAFCEMRDKPDGALAAVASCTVNAEEGSVLATFSSEQTDIISVGDYGFDIWIANDTEKHPIYTTEVKIIGRYTEDIEGENNGN